MQGLLPLLFFVLITFSCNQSEASAVVGKTGSQTANADLAGGKILFKAKVTGIIDGDTVDILYHELPLRIRMEHIDAPEKRGKQAFGNKAKIVISNLCFGQIVTIITNGEFDMGGRLIAEVINEKGMNVNKEMVKLGYAWHFKKYSNDMSYDALEMEARKLNIGLWQDKNPVAPWDFR
ncbi:thermonuclease family protein [Antarcticibacterium sp. 1MA-6-2]|uniref:thermonuclease family protein n=1 Tax=Antarcticibacterium sp. 1MA-6-2 TaxID=2908210 RepID=UPI001F33D495|nr:thermonuclease family protein [Antarcticibacterium sp. 1MA-6-2]UJH90588.1 thermonuclease family protein [Antarcticibacterium sp. 1MA-6-2]